MLTRSDLDDSEQIELDVLFTEEVENLKRRIRRQRATRKNSQLSTTDVVHELFINFQRSLKGRPVSRTAFLKMATAAIRNLLNTEAKRKGNGVFVTLSDLAMPLRYPIEDHLDVDLALTDLNALKPKVGELVAMRIFLGATETELAEYFQISIPTVNRWWKTGKAFLKVRLQGKPMVKETP